MTRIKLPPDTTNNPVIMGIFEELKKAKGFVPDPYRAFSLYEHIVAANWNKTKEVMTKGSVPALLKEKIALAVSFANQCRICISVHTENLQKKGLSEEDIKAVCEARGEDPKIDFVLKFVVTATRDPHTLTDDDFRTLRKFGYEDRDILEILTVMEMYTGYNKILTALDI